MNRIVKKQLRGVAINLLDNAEEIRYIFRDEAPETSTDFLQYVEGWIVTIEAISNMILYHVEQEPAAAYETKPKHEDNCNASTKLMRKYN